MRISRFYAHLPASPQGSWDLSCWGDFRLQPLDLVAVESNPRKPKLSPRLRSTIRLFSSWARLVGRQIPPEGASQPLAITVMSRMGVDQRRSAAGPRADP